MRDMGKIRDAFKDGRIVGGVVALGIAAAVGTGVGVVATSANADQPAVVQTSDPAMTIDLTETTVNGLATEQEAAAAAAEAERLAAEAAAAEAARVAAEQAAQAEAERLAAEQAAAEEPVYSEPAPEEPPASYCPDGYIDDPNLGCHSPICAVLEDGTQVPCQV